MKSRLPSIYTARLVLQPLTPKDAIILHRIYQTDNVLKYFPDPIPPSFERVERFIAGQENHWSQYGYGNWGIKLGTETEIIGWVGLQYLPELEETEVGFLLDRPFWGKGYATEAALTSLEFGFGQFNFDHIIALVHADNLASRRVIEKCGMTYQEDLSLWGINLMRYCIDRDTFDRKFQTR